MRKLKILLALTLSVALLGAAGCSAITGGEDTSTGDFSLALTDAPVNDVDKVMVTLEEVQAIREEDGEEVKETVYDFADEGGQKTFNLLDLRFDEELLGEKQLPNGTYTQLQLIVAGAGFDKQGKPDQDATGRSPANQGESYVVYENGEEENIFIPSGQQTGLKIDHQFTIEEGKVVSLLLDADVREFMHEAGANANEHAQADVNSMIILNPTALDITDKVISGNVAGRVLDNNEEVITDYDVVIEAIQDGEVVKSTVATTEEVDGNPAGSYLISGLEKGDYTLQAKVVDGEGNLATNDSGDPLYEQPTKTITVTATETNENNDFAIKLNN